MASLSDPMDVPGLLVLNSGSATLKWTMFDLRGGEIDMGSAAGVDGDLESLFARWPRPRAVGHRIVHGGPHFVGPIKLDPQIRVELETLVPFAPLHQPSALKGIDAVWRCWPDMTQVGCFDTAFHSTLPDAAARYAVPSEWCERYGLRRYGAHGLSVEWSVRRVSEWLGSAPKRLLVCHLGGGSSFTAVCDGRSLDTTMGLTPLEGPVMGTRSGSIDPGLLLYLLGEGRLTLSELAEGLQRNAGLLGMSGVSADLRRVRAASQKGVPAATEAVEHLLWTYRRAAGAMRGAMGGADAIAFTGGIGEHHAFVRSAIAAAMGDCILDFELNESGRGDRHISAKASNVQAFVIESREDCVIRDQMLRVLAS